MLRNTSDGNELAMPLLMPWKSIVPVGYTVMLMISRIKGVEDSG